MSGRVLIFATIALAAVLGGAVVFAIVTSGSSDAVASLDDLRDKGVMFLVDDHIFLVYNDGDPLALSDDPQHLVGEHTEWCERSHMFETPTHGEKFDRRGYYYAGPAARGLDRHPVRAEGDHLYVNPDELIPGPERGTEKPLEPEGPFCVE